MIPLAEIFFGSAQIRRQSDDFRVGTEVPEFCWKGKFNVSVYPLGSEAVSQSPNSDNTKISY
jgi:hypothetical protein